MKNWKKSSSKIVLDNYWLKIRENSYMLPKGQEIPKYYIEERADSAICVCVSGQNLLLVEQYRPGIEKFTLCHPGGRIEKTDKSALEGALRELLEETGYVPQKWEFLGAYGQIPAVSTARVHVFLVECDKNLRKAQMQDKTEDIKIKEILIAEMPEIIRHGDMDCVACVAASHLALAKLATR